MKHELLWIIGGLCVGAGIVTGISGGFGVACGDVAVCFSQLGYDGVDNLQITGQGAAAIVLVLRPQLSYAQVWEAATRTTRRLYSLGVLGLLAASWPWLWPLARRAATIWAGGVPRVV